jgi:hypothetical protein
VVVTDGTIEAPLFADEVGKVRAAALRALEENAILPVEVLSDAQVTALRAIAKTGKLRDGGPTCAVPPSEDDVIRAAHPEVLSASFSLHCMGGHCNSDLVLLPFGERVRSRVGSPLLEAFASPDDPTSVASWEAALRREDAQPHRPEPTNLVGDGFGFGGLIGAFSFRLVGTFGFGSSLAETAFEASVARAKKCGSQSSGTLVLDVDAKGKVARCEHASSCVCQAFSKQTFGEGAAGRRVLASVVEATRVGGGPTAGLGSLGSLSEGRLGGAHGAKPRTVRVHEVVGKHSRDAQESQCESTLTTCFQDQTSQLQLELHSTLDEGGRVTSASVAKGTLSDTQRACVVRVAKTFAYVCPTRAGDVREVRYVVRVP